MKFAIGTVAAVAALAAPITALPALQDYVVHEKRHALFGSAWTKRDAMDADMTVPVRIG